MEGALRQGMRTVFQNDIVSVPMVRRAVIVAVVVGTILLAINQGDRILADGSVDVAKMLLTYMVPFCVSMYSAISATIRMRAECDQRMARLRETL